MKIRKSWLRKKTGNRTTRIAVLTALLGILASNPTFSAEKYQEKFAKSLRFNVCGPLEERDRNSISTFYKEPSYDNQVESPKPNLNRALIELTALQSFSTIRYWMTHKNRLEGIHKYKFNWRDQSRRIFNFKNWNFDANCFSLNWTHYLAGALYYNISRTNNLSQRDSLLLTVASSAFWELLVEHRSNISINDNLITPLGGLALGEAWYQLGRYLIDNSGFVYRILGFLHPIMKLNRWLDGNTESPDLKSPEPGWHDLRLALGYRNIRTHPQGLGQSLFSASLHSEFIHPQEFGNPGRTNGISKSPVSSEIDLDLSLGKQGMEEINLFSRLVFFGYLKQAIEDNRCGYAFYGGLGSAFTLFKKRTTDPNESCDIKPEKGRPISLEEPRDFSDKFSIVHIIGPVFDGTLLSRDFRLRVLFDAYLDFSLVNAFALSTYAIDHDISGAKSTLLYYGYYYGLGTTLSSRLTLSYKKFNFEGMLRYHVIDSIEGTDALQEEVIDDFNIRDSVLRYKLQISYHLKPAPFEFSVSYEGMNRSGNIKDMTRKGSEQRFFLGAQMRF